MIDVQVLQDNVPAAHAINGGVLEAMIDRAREYVENQTGRYFGPVVETEQVILGIGSRNLYLREPPIIEDDYSLSVEEVPVPGDTPTEVDPTTYELRIDGKEAWLVRYAGAVWTKGYEYVVRYSHGYVVNKGPKDVQQLVIDLIALRLNIKGKEGLQSEQIGGYSYSRPAIYAFTDGDLKQITGGEGTVQAWRRPVVAAG